MGRSRFLSHGLKCFVLCFLVAGCGAGDGELLYASDLDAVYANSDAGQYGIADPAPGVRGVITGRVTYAGTKRSGAIDMGGRPFCQRQNPDGLRYETYLVGPDRGLANVYVYLKKGIDQRLWPVPDEPKVLDQVNCQYVPHFLLLRAGQRLVVKSSDNELHNVKTIAELNPVMNQTMDSPGTLPPITYSKSEVVQFQCDAHRWMSASVAVRDHPCHTLTAEDGTYRIEDVPPGKYQLAFWHEELKDQVFSEIIVIGPNETKSGCDYEYKAK